MDKLASIRAFALVAREGGFSPAARELGVSTAMISKHIKALEDELGVRLLNRSTRRSHLTEAGAAYYQRCLDWLHALDDMEASVRTLSDEVRGTLKVSAPSSFGTLLLVPAILAYKAAHPGVAITLHLTAKMPDIFEGGFDLGIYAGNAQLESSSLVARKLGSFRMIVCASPEYLARHGTPAEPADLARHNCLVFHDEVAHDDWLFRGREAETSVHVAGDLHCNQGNALRVAAAGHMGIIRLPNYLLWEDIRAGRLVEILADHTSPPRAVYALYHQRRHVPAKVRSFLDFLAARFAEQQELAEGG